MPCLPPWSPCVDTFNDLIWPDFTRLPSEAHPFVTLHPLDCGEVTCGDCQVEALPAQHTVPALGYAVGAGRGAGSSAATPLARRPSGPGCANCPCVPWSLKRPLARPSVRWRCAAAICRPPCWWRNCASSAPRRASPIHITHTKPAETADIAAQLQALGAQAAEPQDRPLALEWLASGDEFEL
jgi:hypothetical protein